MVRWAGERVDVYANKIRQLVGLAGFEGAGLLRFTKLAFVTGFPNTISIELQQAPNIETLAMGDLLAQARVLTTGDQAMTWPGLGAHPTVASHLLLRVAPFPMWFAIDATQGSHCKRLPEARDTLFPVWWDWTLGPGLFGKRNRGQGISVSLLPHEDVNAVPPAASIYVDGTKCSALIDTGCSRTIIDADRCRSWRRAIVNVMTIGGMSRLCCGDGMVTVSTEEGSSAKISVLVVRGKPLGFDLLLGIDAIKALGGMVVGPTGSVQFGNKEIVKCAAIFINEPDVTVTFNHRSRAWIVAWKWSEGRAPEALDNRVAEYPVVARIQEDYERELRTWMSNSWLVPYKEDEPRPPPQALIPQMAVLQQHKSKVRLVMDFRRLNCHVDVFTANAAKLREWQQKVPMYPCWTLRGHIFRCVSRRQCGRSRSWRLAGWDTAWHV